MSDVQAFATWARWRDNGQPLKFPSQQPIVEILVTADGLPTVLMWGDRRYVLVEYDGDEDG